MILLSNVGTVSDLQCREDLFLLTDSQEVEAVLETHGLARDLFSTVFVAYGPDCDEPEIYGCHGIPYLWKSVWQIVFNFEPQI